MKPLLITLLLLVPTVAAAEPSTESPIPEDTTIGIGLGVGNRALGGVTAPGIGFLAGSSVGSVRVRLPSGLSIEPTVAMSHSDVDFGGERAAATTLSGGADVRFGVARRGPVQLLGVAGVGVSTSSSDAGDATSTWTSVQASWGLAIDYWVQRHLAVSVAAKNPLVTRSVAGNDGMASLSQTTYGLYLDPSIAMMVHLFY